MLLSACLLNLRSSPIGYIGKFLGIRAYRHEQGLCGIALGSRGLKDVSQYPNLMRELVCRGINHAYRLDSIVGIQKVLRHQLIGWLGMILLRRRDSHRIYKQCHRVFYYNRHCERTKVRYDNSFTEFVNKL